MRAPEGTVGEQPEIIDSIPFVMQLTDEGWRVADLELPADYPRPA